MVKKRNWILFSTSAGQIVASITVSGMNLAFPVIARDFGVNMSSISWLSLISLLVGAGLMLIFGRMGDLVGNKKIYICGYAIYSASSLLMAVFSGNLVTLVVLRGVQAVGTAMSLSVINAIIIGSVPAAERGRALGLNAVMVCIGLSVGPALGGLLIRHFGWVSIFWVFLAAGIFTVVVSIKALPNFRTEPRKLDVKGAISWFCFISSLLFSVQYGNNVGYTSPIILGSFLISITSLLLFIRVERRSPDPLIRLSLFRNAEFNIVTLGIISSFMAQYMAVFLMPFYLVDVKSVSSDISGLIMLIHPIVMMALARFSGSASDRWGYKPLTIAGLAAATLTCVLLGLLGKSTPLAWAFVGLFGVGLGSGLYTSPGNSAIMSSVPSDQIGTASGMVATTRTIGQTIGVSLGSSIVSRRLLTYTAVQLDKAGAYSLAQRDAFWVCALFMAAVTLITLWAYRSGAGGSGKPVRRLNTSDSALSSD